ncbi:MAG: DUF368 domain-containing protein [Verrucomicrobiales bacterium]
MPPISELFGALWKGAAMGAANVIPGVSGGTIAFITGIYERLINALKAFDITAVKLLLGFRLREFAQKIDFFFLAAIGVGALLSILSLAKGLKWMFEHEEVLLLAFFFGLILASIYSVGKMVKRWGAAEFLLCLLGAGIAVGIAFLKPAEENANMAFLVLCGAVAISSMIIPGISGSFVLLILGNYMLVLGAIDGLRADPAGNFAASLKILAPFAVGCVVGLLALSHFLSWLFREHHDRAVTLITGFIAGSLLIIWPWKDKIYLEGSVGKAAEKPIGYDWLLPDFASGHTWAAIGLMVGGAVLVLLVEKLGAAKPAK